MQRSAGYVQSWNRSVGVGVAGWDKVVPSVDFAQRKQNKHDAGNGPSDEQEELGEAVKEGIYNSQVLKRITGAGKCR